MKSLVSQIRQNMIILTMGVMMQTFRPSLLEGVHLYVHTKSNGSSFKNEKREREIKSWLLAHLCTPGQLQQEVSCSGDPEQSDKHLVSKYINTFSLSVWAVEQVPALSTDRVNGASFLSSCDGAAAVSAPHPRNLTPRYQQDSLGGKCQSSESRQRSEVWFSPTLCSSFDSRSCRFIRVQSAIMLTVRCQSLWCNLYSTAAKEEEDHP